MALDLTGARIVHYDDYNASPEDVQTALEVVDRMKAKYGERYRDMLEVLYQLTEPTKKE